MEYSNLHYLPLSLFFLFPITILITYSMAVCWSHVAAVLPYISETGDLSPESCIFTQLLTIGAFLLGSCMYVRHRQVMEFNKLYPENSVPNIINKLSILLGSLTCIGLDILANFQESRFGFIHFMGASVCFIAGTLYFCIQAYITSNMSVYTGSECMTYARACLAALAIVLTVLTIFPGVMSIKYFKGEDFKMWGPEDGGWEWHLVSVISEWALVFVYCLLILTFVPDFKNLKLTAPAITLSTVYDLKENGPTEVRFS